LRFDAAHQQVSTAAAAASGRLVIIDGAVQDRQALIDGILNSSPALSPAELPTILVLDPSQDGVAQISRILQSRSQLEAIHIFSHGHSGLLQLGTT
jgi:hypothetical protein